MRVVPRRFVIALDPTALETASTAARALSQIVARRREGAVRVVVGPTEALLGTWSLNEGDEPSGHDAAIERLERSLSDLESCLAAGLTALAVRPPKLAEGVERLLFSARLLARRGDSLAAVRDALPAAGMVVATLLARAVTALGLATEVTAYRVRGTAEPSGPLVVTAGGPLQADPVRIVAVAEAADVIDVAAEMIDGDGANVLVACSAAKGPHTADLRLVPGAAPVARLGLDDRDELAELFPMPRRATVTRLSARGVALNLVWIAEATSSAVVDSASIADGSATCLLSRRSLALVHLSAERQASPDWIERHGGLALRRADAPTASTEGTKDDVAPLGLITLVAPGLARRASVATTFLRALAASGATLVATWQPRPRTSLSCLVPSEEVSDTVRALHDAIPFSERVIAGRRQPRTRPATCGGARCARPRTFDARRTGTDRERDRATRQGNLRLDAWIDREIAPCTHCIDARVPCPWAQDTQLL